MGSSVTFSEAHLDQLRSLVEQKTGLVLSTPKMRELREQLTDLLDADGNINKFFQQLNASPDIQQGLVNKLTIGESYFFRNHPHFSALKNEIIPALIQKKEVSRSLKIWSAGSSTGEEPYSLAILLKRDFPMLNNWDVKIIATDINTDFIEKARTGTYTKWSFRGVDNPTIHRYFTERENNTYEIDPLIKQSVSFSRLNLSTIPNHVEPHLKHCDLILCRNVLIYFQIELATRICETFSDCLNDGGYLMLGHSEAFPALRDLKTVYSHATYYYRKEQAAAPPSRPPHSRMSVVPGLGPYNPDKMIMPWEQQDPPVPADWDNPHVAVSPRTSFASLDLEMRSAIEQDLMRVRDYSMDGNLREAETLLNKLEATDGKLDFRVYFLKALIADQCNEPEEALTHLKQAIFLNKDFTIGHYYQGIIAERFGDIIAAKRGYRNAYRLADQLRPDAEVSEGGGIRARILCEIAKERLKELELQNEQ
ncbi:MAG: hypothetical protein JXX29_13665 [Deltaproteobacteria bacterium]|nr:hypothetical protein [Deltaproteobacteria bacterium]MBN2672727.1 hypothetical protein [Deltaproteobacteria bacterium]